MSVNYKRDIRTEDGWTRLWISGASRVKSWRWAKGRRISGGGGRIECTGCCIGLHADDYRFFWSDSEWGAGEMLERNTRVSVRFFFLVSEGVRGQSSFLMTIDPGASRPLWRSWPQFTTVPHRSSSPPAPNVPPPRRRWTSLGTADSVCRGLSINTVNPFAR